jgi:hypothetical protein
MVAMPYLVANMVLELLSLVLFCMTSAALLYPLTHRYLPAFLRNHRTFTVVAQGLVLSVLAMVVVLAIARGRSLYLFIHIFELLCYIGLANAVVLTYGFLDGRLLRNIPKVQRRLLITLCSVVMIAAAFIAVFAAVVRLFVMR